MTGKNRSLFAPLLDSGDAIDVSPQTPSSQIARPPIPYSSQPIFFQTRAAEISGLNSQIEAKEGELTTWLKAIADNLDKIPYPSIANKLKDAFARDVKNIPPLKNLIREQYCSCLCSKECCCFFCGITLTGAGMGAGIGILSSFLGSLFSFNTCNSTIVATSSCYGAIVGGGAGFMINLAVYLKGFYEVV